MNEKIKTQLHEYLDLKLQLCKQYMQEQDLTAAKTVWQQAIGAVEFTAMSQFGINFDNDLAIEIEDIWLSDFKEAFEKTLFPEVGGMTPLRIRFSNHALNERADRIAYIATTIGFGEVIARKLVVDERGKAMRLLTDTGVIIVTDPHEECILTMWIADPTQVKDFYPDGVRNQAVLRLVKKYMEKGYQNEQNKQKKGN